MVNPPTVALPPPNTANVPLPESARSIIANIFEGVVNLGCCTLLLLITHRGNTGRTNDLDSPAARDCTITWPTCRYRLEQLSNQSCAITSTRSLSCVFPCYPEVAFAKVVPYYTIRSSSENPLHWHCFCRPSDCQPLIQHDCFRTSL